MSTNLDNEIPKYSHYVNVSLRWERNTRVKNSEEGKAKITTMKTDTIMCSGNPDTTSAQLSSVQSLSRVRLFVTPWTAARQASLSITNSWSSLKLTSSQWCHPAISFSVVPFSSCSQSLPASEFFPVGQLFTSGGQSIGASASASVLLMTIQGLFPLELTGLISLQSKELSRVFPSTTVQKHQFSGAQPSLWSNSHICTQLLKNHNFD